MDDFLSQLSDEDLCNLVGGQPNAGVPTQTASGTSCSTASRTSSRQMGRQACGSLPETGLPHDRLTCATLPACTFDPDICYQVGRAGAEEMKENNKRLAPPAVNIHRSPLCGRNFEYYSEDPYAGTQAAAMVRGIQSLHIGRVSSTSAATTRRRTRYRTPTPRVSERAIREIYLRQFEINVKTAHPYMIMTSYNEINGWRASENRALLKDPAAGGGFDGCITTDWWN